LVPLLSVQSLDLTIRFHQNRLPSRIWHLDGVPSITIDAPTPTGELIGTDSLGEVNLSFHQLRQGLGYGARWEYPD
jgi:hypothetical protein